MNRRGFFGRVAVAIVLVSTLDGKALSAVLNPPFVGRFAGPPIIGVGGFGFELNSGSTLNKDNMYNYLNKEFILKEEE